MRRPLWVGRSLALAIHDRQLAEHGGGSGIRDESLLDSALARPQQLYSYGKPPPDLAALAAALAVGLVKNHPFVDGNKRTAHVCYRAFLAINGMELVAGDEDKYITMVALAEGSLTEGDFAEWLRARVIKKPTGRVQEKRAKYRS